MPDFCAAYGWSNRCSLKTRARGITFHLFPKTGKMRRQWELALRRDGFVASDRTLLRSKHFRSEDFDRTGRNVRLKDGVVPTIFNFPAHLQRLVATRSTTTSRRAEDNLPMDLSRDAPQPDVAYSPIRSINGSIIWKYIVHLNNVQKKSGLHAANRVTDKHVNFAYQKMKVSLAAQTLSSSVAVALHTLQEVGMIGHERIQGKCLTLL
uniref:THAP-type domain-containing protein n=1 Tax=Dicentrarchus labrax TaxID=13489 RepID=A0A8C4NNJ2_DICLA